MNTQLRKRLTAHLKLIYPGHDHLDLQDKICEAFWPAGSKPRRARRAPGSSQWSQKDCLLITYGDSVFSPGRRPLKVLDQFLKEEIGDTITGVHVLPFFPYTSDDGFAVQDYMTVNLELGCWEHIEAIAQTYELMADLVINHASASCEWFKQYQRGEAPGIDYFIEVDPDENLTEVVRPRPSPLLRDTETTRGTRHVWCTFGHDQVDLNFSNPDVLIEFIRILAFYISKGVTVVRLDAVAFLWKIVGTPCVHLDQTHEIVRLLRTLVDYHEHSVALITETNVASPENLSYLGNQNEAHSVYNFPLPPLVLHTLLTGSSSRLNAWLMSVPPAPPGSAYLNFIASHDGIGLRPCEGLLEPAEIEALIASVRANGGAVSMRSDRTGLHQPYELNISLYDALAGRGSGRDGLQNNRFICSQIIMMSLEGVPAFYIHSLIGSENDMDSLNRTQHNRAINRRKWDLDTLRGLLADSRTHHYQIFHRLLALIRVRGRQPAFHPNATQYTLQLGDHLFGVWRQSRDRTQSIFAVMNISDTPQDLPLIEINLICGVTWTDLISNTSISDVRDTIKLEPYQCIWLTNKLH